MAQSPIAQIIDLTNESDEDSPSSTKPPNFTSRPDVIEIEDDVLPISPSNHGLKLGGSAPVLHLRRKDGFNYISSTARPPPRSPATNGLAAARQVSNPKIATTITSKILTKATLAQKAGPNEGRYETPSKRRKTDNGFILQEQSAVVVPFSQSNSLSSNVAIHPAISPVAGNAVSRVHRAQRTSKVGRIQTSLSGIPTEHQEKIARVLKRQVFRHIQSAIKSHTNLSRDNRSDIGLKTAEILIDDDSFYHDLLANNWLLSMEYERKLSIRARTLVDRYASKFPERTGAIGLLEPAQENRDLEIAILRKHPKKSADLPTEEEVSSEDSEDEVDLSESPKLPTRNYSSSPATSASNDADRASIMHVDSHDETQPSRVVEKGPLVKLRRSGRFRISDIQRNTHTKLTVNETQQNNLVSQRRDVDHNVLNQVRSFRLVGGATSIERPYICLEDRQDICRGLELGQLSTAEKRLLEHSVLHVDFCSEELEFIRTIIQTYKRLVPDPHVEISSLMANEESNIPTLIRLIQEKARLPEQYVGRTLIRNRDSTSLAAFLRDAATGNIAANSNMTKAIRLQARPLLSNPRIAPQPSISSMLRQREILGLRQRRGSKGLRPFRMEVYSKIEDSLVHQREWVDCCGDISSLSWTGAGDTTFICGALAHSDSHNMQYNKPGNLLVGSVPLDTLKALADHRIVRPIVSDKVNAENSLEAMRQTQDPWLYTSVVSTSHSKTNGFSFTASFDKSVRVWKVAEDGSSMDLCSTWDHEEKVNFVVTSDHHDLVATASDVSSGAIRVYCFDTKNATSFFYNTYNGDRSQEQALKVRENDNWAYFPATIAWGRAPKVSNHLLVGYSPRSITVDESEIPEDKKNTGELCLWNVDSGSRISIASAHTQNVFEVLWHPTQPIFLAATSPCGLFEPADTKTQIRVFGQNEVGVFINIKTLDCPALDINELTIMATSDRNSYVTASCTDANTYVWDTAQGDRPLHVLGHGDSLDNPLHDLPREIADSGVKFAAWGRTVDRFYTGSSDGKVKAWDIRKPKGHTFVRTVLSVAGGISAGAFSSNYSALIIGDATGKVHLLKIDEQEEKTGLQHSISGSNSTYPEQNAALQAHLKKRPKLIIHHPEPALPSRSSGFESGAEEDDLELPVTACDLSNMFLNEGHLEIHPDPGIGVTQGPNYSETKLYCRVLHEDEDITKPLLPEWQVQQRYELRNTYNLELSTLPEVISSSHELHAKNTELEFDLSKLSLKEQKELIRDEIDLDFESDDRFDLEIMPSFKSFRKIKTRRRLHNL